MDIQKDVQKKYPIIIKDKKREDLKRQKKMDYFFVQSLMINIQLWILMVVFQKTFLEMKS